LSLIIIQKFQSQFHFTTFCSNKSHDITTTSKWGLFHLHSSDTICNKLPLIKLMQKLLRSFFFFFFSYLTIIRWSQLKNVKLANNIMDVQQIQQYIVFITRIHTIGCMFEWTIMPFGMKNATNTFSKTMTKVFGEYLNKFLKVFVDDLNIHSHSWEQHLEHLCFVLLII
jgi:hypothetical protein